MALFQGQEGSACHMTVKQLLRKDKFIFLTYCIYEVHKWQWWETRCFQAVSGNAGL